MHGVATASNPGMEATAPDPGAGILTRGCREEAERFARRLCEVSGLADCYREHLVSWELNKLVALIFPI